MKSQNLFSGKKQKKKKKQKKNKKNIFKGRLLIFFFFFFFFFFLSNMLRFNLDLSKDIGYSNHHENMPI